MEYVTIEETRKYLGLPSDIFSAVAHSGLLGYTVDEKFPQVAIEHFQLFGTQWREDLGLRQLGNGTFREMERTVPGQSVICPPTTHSQVQIASSGKLNLADKDHGWLAQFYLKVNKFFFPDPFSSAVVGGIPIRMSRWKDVRGASLPTFAFPDVSGHLAMFMVMGNPSPKGEPYKVALDVILPILDELASRFDYPLSIAHSMVVGVPSGVITIDMPNPYKEVLLTEDDDILAHTPYEELATSLALYREAMSSPNPFHQFLSYWKAYENACQVRGHWCNIYKRRAPKREPEIFPDAWAFRSIIGKTFDQVKQQLNDSYRNALAHGGYFMKTIPRAATTAAQYSDVAVHVPLIRFMANVTINNVRCAFESVR